MRKLSRNGIGVVSWCYAAPWLHFLFVIWRCFTISKDQIINDSIKHKEVRLIGKDGAQLGIMKGEEALRLATEEGLDLVEIAPDAKPPVCKIMDYGKYRFEREKKEKEQRKKRQVVELKEIQLKCRIDTHDFNTKLNHAKRFLEDGNKVKVVVRFSGREITRSEQGKALLDRFAEAVAETGVVEKPALLEGRNMIMIMAPKKASTTTKGKKTDGEN